MLRLPTCLIHSRQWSALPASVNHGGISNILRRRSQRNLLNSQTQQKRQKPPLVKNPKRNRADRPKPNNKMVSGTATLVSGTVTVTNAAIGATSRIVISRTSASTSTVLGALIVTKSVGQFVITSKDPATPANTLTGDVSIVDYMILY